MNGFAPDENFHALRPELLLSALPDVVFHLDGEGRWGYLNEAWQRLTGHPVADSLGSPLSAFAHPDDAPWLQDLFRRERLEDGPLQLRLLTRDGLARWVELDLAPLPSAGGWAGTLTDITERNLTEAAAHEEKELAQATLAAIGDGVVTTNTDGRVTFLNQAAQDLLGYHPGEAHGSPVHQVLDLRDPNSGDYLDPGWHCLREESSFCSSAPTALTTGSGGRAAVHWTASPLHTATGTLFGCIVVFRDVTREDALQRQLEHQATHDALTGLVNRASLHEALEHEHRHATDGHAPYSLLILDLDHFKVTNDNYGHAAGDRLLLQVAELLQDEFRHGEWVGRWGGEEFLCLLPETDSESALERAERLRARIEASHLDADGVGIPFTASIGAATYPDHADNAESLIMAADAALFEAKRGGRNRVVGGESEGSATLSMASRIKRAVEDNRIVPAFQPIVDLNSGETVAEEALARLVDESGEALTAGAFIEAASNLQLVHAIDHRLIEQTLAQCATQVQAGIPRTHFVNISADLLQHSQRVTQLLEAAAEHCNACAPLLGNRKPMVIEITERQLLADTDHALRTLQPFLDVGFQLAIDDFGSGYSSFQYLADLPVSYLKMEGSLVRRAAAEPRIAAIIRGLQDIADELGLTTIAEWVEDEETVALLREVGVNWAQGFHFGRPALNG